MNHLTLDISGYESAPERFEHECRNRCGCKVENLGEYCCKECHEEDAWEDYKD